MGNSFGNFFKISTWGESHGIAVGVVVDGCPPGLPITRQEIQFELNRRRPGQSDITTTRKENDNLNIMSGVYQGLTLGTPIAMQVLNKEARSKDYDNIKNKFRPSHADYTYYKKFGYRDHRGGGRSSARETIGRVAAGTIAKKILYFANNIQISSYVERIQNIKMPPINFFPSIKEIDASPVRCPNIRIAKAMIKKIKEINLKGDSIGGTIICRIKNIKTGLGCPVFDRLEADLAKAMLSIPATKGFEIGSGFLGTHFLGSKHNDSFFIKKNKIRTKTNRSGGIQGGISNGEEIYFRIAFKPTATIMQPQLTVTQNKKKVKIKNQGRHDPCVLPRAVPIVEAMTALVLVDHWMRQKSQCESFIFK